MTKSNKVDMLIYQENKDFATSGTAKSLETGTNIYLCAGKELLNNAKKIL